MSTGLPSQDGYSPLTSPVPIVLPQTPVRGVEAKPTVTGRVLHVVNGQHYSGAERVQDLLALRLPEFGFEVAFACLRPDQFPKTRRSQKTPLFQVPMRSRVDFSVLRTLTRIAREGDFDAIHAHTPRSLLLASMAARRLKLPLIYHVHSPASRDSTRRIRSWINGRVEALGLAQVTRILTVSQSLANHMKHMGLSAEHITVVPNGVPTTDLQRDSQSPTSTWTLGTIALFRPRKGTEVLIDAMAQLRQQGYDVRLRAVGPFETSDYQRELLDRVARHDLNDAVDWVGFTEDVNAELRRMDLFVLPSLFGEGLPMVVLEAMAAGVPPVGTAVEGVPEAIHDGVSGVLAQPGDAGDLARAMTRIIDGQVNWCCLRENAIVRHADFFSDTAMARGVAEAYHKVLS